MLSCGDNKLAVAGKGAIPGAGTALRGDAAGTMHEGRRKGAFFIANT
jgi:hypothetical protein